MASDLASVLDGTRRWAIAEGDCLDVMRQLPPGSCHLALASPPYEAARTYSVGFDLKGQDWVDWMIPRVLEACRVTQGIVLINAAGQVRQHQYSPVVEWLVADLTRQYGIVCGPAPYCFFRFGIPGSGREHYHRRDWEPVYAFCRPEVLPLSWSDNTAMGHPPKYAPGGAMSHRLTSGQRVNKPRKVMTRKREGTRPGDNPYHAPTLANPGNVIREQYDAEEVRQLFEDSVCGRLEPGDVIRCMVGGGAMGSRLAHANEAAFPERLVEFLVRSYCPPGGVVLDPFSGSGTTAAVALRHGRRAIGIDLRASQAGLACKRLAGETPSLFS